MNCIAPVKSADVYQIKTRSQSVRCLKLLRLLYWICVSRFCQPGGGHSGGFCEKLLEASPMSDRANASWLQDVPCCWPRSSISVTVVAPL